MRTAYCEVKRGGLTVERRSRRSRTEAQRRKMVMLIASYPTILNESTYLQNCVALEKNDAQMLPQFRNWNDFDYHIDLSTCTNIPHGLRDATLTIRDPKSKKPVWMLSI